MLMKIKEKQVLKILSIEIFEQGRVETNGTEVSAILPPMNMFTPTNDRQEKKNKVIDKLLEFFDRFFSITGK